jgi:hypothetical protein
MKSVRANKWLRTAILNKEEEEEEEEATNAII